MGTAKRNRIDKLHGISMAIHGRRAETLHEQRPISCIVVGNIFIDRPKARTILESDSHAIYGHGIRGNIFLHYHGYRSPIVSSRGKTGLEGGIQVKCIVICHDIVYPGRIIQWVLRPRAAASHHDHNYRNEKFSFHNKNNKIT